ncbi:hypothetical protein NP233_g11036 [Leucocoprinus birnbaumii]|uniref:Uncharacterized protein n=1 Tax=Leucocoprinus birnbaumii TaxID=56174 RepID=A0AAD5VN65_9AGAR|nr:hypothetical protein NP233_g11036 [Leucocoprinus birnbaumii]
MQRKTPLYRPGSRAARGRSPTPRNDPAAFHAPQAQAHQYGAHLDPSPIPFAKPNLSPFTGQNQNQTSHIRHTLLPSTSSPPYTFSDLHHRNHYYHSDGGDVLGVKSDVTLRLKSLAIVGSASSDPSAPQDPDSSQTALDLLKVLLLSPPSCSHTSNSSNIVTGSGTRNDRQSSAVPFNPGSRAPAASSLVHVYTNGIPRSNTDNHHQHVFNDECEDEGPLVDPYSLKKLALPNVEFGKIPEMIDILSRCGPGGNGIEELTLSDRLSHSGATFPMNSNTSSRNNASEVDFSALQSLRALRLGAYISPTFVQLQPQIHLSRAALLASTLPSPHDFSTVTAQVSTRQLTWLVEALRTIPPELDSLSLGLSIDKSLIRLHGQGHSTTVQFIDDEIREIVDYLRTIQNRRPRLRIDVTSKFTSSLPTSFGSTFLGSGFSTGAGAGECYSEDRGRGEVRGRSWDYASRSRGDERISGGQGDLSRGAGEDGLRRWVGDVFSGVTDLG